MGIPARVRSSGEQPGKVVRLEFQKHGKGLINIKEKIPNGAEVLRQFSRSGRN